MGAINHLLRPRQRLVLRDFLFCDGPPRITASGVISRSIMSCRISYPQFPPAPCLSGSPLLSGAFSQIPVLTMAPRNIPLRQNPVKKKGPHMCRIFFWCGWLYLDPVSSLQKVEATSPGRLGLPAFDHRTDRATRR